MKMYRWEKGSYPICPKCKRSSVVFMPYNKRYERGFMRIHGYKKPDGYLIVRAKCLWGCEFTCMIPEDYHEVS